MSTLLSLQVTSASVEAPAATHPPAREPEPWLGIPAESLLRGPKTAQELAPARCQQSGLDGAGRDLAGTGRCQLFVSPGLGVDPAALAGRGPQSQLWLGVPPHQRRVLAESPEAESPVLAFGFFWFLSSSGIKPNCDLISIPASSLVRRQSLFVVRIYLSLCLILCTRPF